MHCSIKCSWWAHQILTVTFDFDPLCSGTHHSISVSHMSVELVQFMSQLLNIFMFIQIFTHVKFAENKCSWQWEDVSFFAELIFIHIYLSEMLLLLIPFLSDLGWSSIHSRLVVGNITATKIQPPFKHPGLPGLQNLSKHVNFDIRNGNSLQLTTNTHPITYISIITNRDWQF